MKEGQADRMWKMKNACMFVGKSEGNRPLEVRRSK
jgi:hypothetical protein